MALEDLMISKLPDGTLAPTATFAVENPDQQEASGYKSYGIEASEIKDKLLNSFQYTQSLDTTDKKIVGAVAELVSEIGIKWKAHCEAGYGVIFNHPIFLDPNVEIELYSDNTSGIRQLFVQNDELWIMYADTSEAYDVEVIARHGLV